MNSSDRRELEQLRREKERRIRDLQSLGLMPTPPDPNDYPDRFWQHTNCQNCGMDWTYVSEGYYMRKPRVKCPHCGAKPGWTIVE